MYFCLYVIFFVKCYFLFTGRRKCLGETVARNTIFIFTACLIQKLHFMLPEKYPKLCLQGVDGFITAPPDRNPMPLIPLVETPFAMSDDFLPVSRQKENPFDFSKTGSPGQAASTSSAITRINFSSFNPSSRSFRRLIRASSGWSATRISRKPFELFVSAEKYARSWNASAASIPFKSGRKWKYPAGGTRRFFRKHRERNKRLIFGAELRQRTYTRRKRVLFHVL